MKTIPLTQGKVALVDDEDFKWLSQWKWQLKTDRSGNQYASRMQSGPNGVRKLVLMHIVVKPPPEGMINDHRDGNGINNQKQNLRAATRSQNCMNRRSRKQHGFKGIAFQKNLKKWTASVRTKGKYYHLGVFGTAREAAEAYNAKAVELFGSFANLNSL